MARICIVTPGQLGSNPRVVKEADVLSEAGHQVHVIATRTLDALENHDQRVLAGAAWTAERIDLRSRARRLPGRMAQAAARVVGARSGAAQSPLYSPLAAAAGRHNPDLFIAHYTPALAAVASAANSQRAAFAFDAEDFHPGDLPDAPEFAAQNRRIRDVEARWLPRCRYVTAASPGIAKAYAAAYGLGEPTVVLNVFSRREGPVAPAVAGVRRPGPSLYWFSQTLGPDRGLEWAIAAIARARSAPHLYLRGNPVPGYDHRLQDMARELGCEHRLHLLAPVAPDALIPEMVEFDAGYVGETGVTSNRRIALTNKLFCYLTAGLPVLASDIPAHRDLAGAMNECLGLFSLGDVDALAAQMDSLFQNPERLAAGRSAAWRLGQDRFDWESEKLKLVETVATAIGAGD